MIGESIPLKTIIAKTKSDRKPWGEIKYVDMNGFALIIFENEDCNHVYFDQPGMFRGKSLI